MPKVKEACSRALKCPDLTSRVTSRSTSSPVIFSLSSAAVDGE